MAMVVYASSSDVALPTTTTPSVEVDAPVDSSTGSGGIPAAGWGFDAHAALVKAVRRSGPLSGKGKSTLKTNTKKNAEPPVKIDYRKFAQTQGSQFVSR